MFLIHCHLLHHIYGLCMCHLQHFLLINPAWGRILVAYNSFHKMVMSMTLLAPCIQCCSISLMCYLHVNLNFCSCIIGWFHCMEEMGLIEVKMPIIFSEIVFEYLKNSISNTWSILWKYSCGSKFFRHANKPISLIPVSSMEINTILKDKRITIMVFKRFVSSFGRRDALQMKLSCILVWKSIWWHLVEIDFVNLLWQMKLCMRPSKPFSALLIWRNIKISSSFGGSCFISC